MGTYPACSTPPVVPEPTCADSGQVGTYPACTDPDPSCTPDNSCRTNTCTGSSCTDSCGYSYSGTKTDGVCALPPGMCTSPTVSITATPSRVRAGGSATLTVTGSGLNQACTITGPGVSQTMTPNSCNASALITTPAITTQSTYTVSCPEGSATATVIVNINPVFTPF
ncbi:MAG: hypothetical protein AAB037_02030 [Chloroflexota bacterium]